MRLHLEGVIRGRVVWVEWQDGALDGDQELLDRLDRHARVRRVDLRDASAVLKALEEVSGQRLELRVVDARRRAVPA